MSDVAFRSLPACETFRLIDFEEAALHSGVAGGWILVVRGEKPYLNMDVQLAPRVYIQQPEFWEIEVVGSLSGGVVLDVTGPYSVNLPLEGTMGKKGIEVVGAEKTKRIEVQVGKPAPS
ncbi:MAG: hypothetical protein H0W23_02345 [Chloroflexia bacterium]|nr:hypothetical protein [Chloroflexia bacterium]